MELHNQDYKLIMAFRRSMITAAGSELLNQNPRASTSFAHNGLAVVFAWLLLSAVLGNPGMELHNKDYKLIMAFRRSMITAAGSELLNQNPRASTSFAHNGLAVVFAWLLLSAVLGNHTGAVEIQNKETYIIYMGGVTSNDGDIRNDHMDLVNSLTDRSENIVLHTYRHGFLGFAARLTEEEAKSLSTRTGIVSVFRDINFQLQTTRSWDFLEQQRVGQKVEFDDSTPTTAESSTDGSDTIIGFLDSVWSRIHMALFQEFEVKTHQSQEFGQNQIVSMIGIWVRSLHAGKEYAWKDKISRPPIATGMKLIGARYYEDPAFEPHSVVSPRDGTGHGTHVASTAAGRSVSGASYYGLARGTARGGSPNARIAMYRVCSPNEQIGCLGSVILKAFDDAIVDGVDILSISLAPDLKDSQDFSTDPIAIGAYHAVQNGITVVCSAGNKGPGHGTVRNVAPWILTVGATTIDREFMTGLVLGGRSAENQKAIKGHGINFSNLDRNPIYPLIDGVSAKLGSSNQTDEISARFCIPGALDGAKLKGSILVCIVSTVINYNFEILKNQPGIIGMIVIDNSILVRHVPPIYGTYPIVTIDEDDGAQVLSYIKSNSNPMATILATVVVPNYEPAPVVAHFSSRGRTPGIAGILKPDIAAPGVMILAAWPAFITAETVKGREPPPYAFLSGTSMACPHAAGIVATIKSHRHTWGPSIIRSAIMTTGPLQPGLVYETELSDYNMFLCDIGYEPAKIKLIAQDIADNFSCPINKSRDYVSNMNYPSISISHLKENEVRSVTRVVTNVGDANSTYDVVVEAPACVDVQVVPGKLQFSKDVHKLHFQANFKMRKASREDVFGSISWMNEKRKVRSPFVLMGNPNATYSGYTKCGNPISDILFLCHMIGWLYFYSY
ncbi:hypothetical protein OROHE_023400 [Orobanche hederae]